MGIKATVVPWLTICLIGCVSHTTAPARATDNTMTQLRKEFDNCVYGSISSQISHNKQVEPGLATEIAFQSCATEEQAIIGYGLGMGIPAYQLAPVMAGVKRQIKNTVRDIFANPAKYAFPSGRK